MENVNCLICDINKTRTLVEKNGFQVVACQNCGLVYLNPRLTQEELVRLYDQGTNHIEDADVDTGNDSDHDQHKRKKFQIAIELIKQHKSDVNQVFDLGCSTGIFLDMVTKEGWTAFGSDVNSAHIQRHAARYGDRVHLQVGDRIDFPEKMFDVVTLFDSIEHLPNPIKSLQEVSRVLCDDGLLVVTTPNVDGLFPTVTYGLFGRTLGAWEHPTPPGHVYQFSPETLRKTLTAAGFSWVAMRDFEIFGPYTVGELENSLITAIRGRSQNKSDGSGASSSHQIHTDGGGGETASRPSMGAGLPRKMVHGLSAGLVALLYPVARALSRGDSMIVVASKTNPQSS